MQFSVIYTCGVQIISSPLVTNSGFIIESVKEDLNFRWNVTISQQISYFDINQRLVSISEFFLLLIKHDFLYPFSFHFINKPEPSLPIIS